MFVSIDLNEIAITDWIFQTNLCEQEPVSVVALLDDGADVAAVVGAATVAQEGEAAVGGGDGEETEQDVDRGPDGKHDEPVFKRNNQ